MSRYKVAASSQAVTKADLLKNTQTNTIYQQFLHTARGEQVLYSGQFDRTKTLNCTQMINCTQMTGCTQMMGWFTLSCDPFLYVSSACVLLMCACRASPVFSLCTLSPPRHHTTAFQLHFAMCITHSGSLTGCLNKHIPWRITRKREFLLLVTEQASESDLLISDPRIIYVDSGSWKQKVC